jgi:hypothetical protein
MIEALRKLITQQVKACTDADLLDLVHKLLSEADRKEVSA